MDYQQTKKNLEANNEIDIEKLHKLGLCYFIKGYAEKNLKYIESDTLTIALEMTMPHDPTEIEQIARAISIRDPNHITEMDMLMYEQIIKVLKEVKT